MLGAPTNRSGIVIAPVRARAAAIAGCCALIAGGLGMPSYAAGSIPDLQAAQWASSCVTCHGAADPVGGSTIPMLAGLPAARIEKQMKEFASGAKPGVLMQQLARGYSPEVIHAIALWYARLVPEKP